LSILEEIGRAQGSMNFAAQYQQEPVPAGGNIIRRSWLRHYESCPESFDRIVVSWDTASTTSDTSDWSVGTVWGVIGFDFYLLDVYRERVEVPALRRAIIRLHRQYRAAATVIEETELGRAIAQELRHDAPFRPLAIRPQRDKVARLLAQAARFEAGQIHLPENAPWLATYISELLAFPNGANDDQVDATSQALNYLAHGVSAARPLIRRDIHRRDTVRRT